jgi:IS5 family transposase
MVVGSRRLNAGEPPGRSGAGGGVTGPQVAGQAGRGRRGRAHADEATVVAGAMERRGRVNPVPWTAGDKARYSAESRIQ